MSGEAGSLAALRGRGRELQICAVRALVALFVLLLAGCAAQPATVDSDKIDHLLMLVHQRLGYMDDVARNKWNSGAAIEDLPRERAIIESIGKQAAGYGLDAAVAEDFFRAQIEASKIIQNARFREWRASGQPKFAKVLDLGKDIRPALDALTPAMMSALAAAMPALRTPQGPALVAARAQVLVVPPAGVAARDEAVAPLQRISRNR